MSVLLFPNQSGNSRESAIKAHAGELKRREPACIGPPWPVVTKEARQAHDIVAVDAHQCLDEVSERLNCDRHGAESRRDAALHGHGEAAQLGRTRFSWLPSGLVSRRLNRCRQCPCDRTSAGCQNPRPREPRRAIARDNHYSTSFGA